MKWIFLILAINFIFGCNKSQRIDEYFSIEKSQLNTSYGRFENDFNFYKFQMYYQSIRVDSIYLDNYHTNFEDSIIYNFLKSQYFERGYDHSLTLLTQIGRINRDNFNDTSIIVLDLNDSITLVNLSPGFAIYALGTCCSDYQNLILRKRNNAVIYSLAQDELIPSKLLGIYAKSNGTISGLLMQGYSNNYSSFFGLNSTYTAKYDITEKGIIPVEITNVRNGEPFDKNDKISKNLKDFGAISYYF